MGLILYSTNTKLAYIIAKEYYGNKHYVWCSPYFDCRSASSLDRRNPPSSNPCEIYYNYKNDAERNDFHSAIIAQNRAGILVGASKKKAAGIINDNKEKEIISIVNSAGPDSFKPLIYLIPKNEVTGICKITEVSVRANPLSKEYLIEELDRNLFDIIEF